MSDHMLSAGPPALPARQGRMFRWDSGRAMFIAGLVLGVFVLLSSFVGPFIYPPDPFALHPSHALEGPSSRFPLGTDELGRDEMALLFSGGLATLAVSLPAALLAFVVGVAYGLASGLGPGWLDRLLMRLLDAMLALPSLVVLLFFASLVTLSNGSLVLLLGLISWPPLARLVRNETLAQKGRDFVLASEQFGASRFYIARKHLLRVMAPILVVNGTFMVGDTIFALSALSFLGLGVQPPRVSWGSLLETALDIIALNPWWMILPPGILVFAALLATSLIGQGMLARWSSRQ